VILTLTPVTKPNPLVFLCSGGSSATINNCCFLWRVFWSLQCCIFNCTPFGSECWSVEISSVYSCVWSRDSSVGIATRYGLEGPGIESRWGEIFRTYPDQLRVTPSFLYNGYRVFPRGKGGRGVMLTTHPLLVPRLRKSWAILPLTLWVLLGLLRGSLYLFTVAYTQLVWDRIGSPVFDIVPSRYLMSSWTVKFPFCYKLDRQRFGILGHICRMVDFRRMRSNISV
jgi:hypothetical protein